MVNKIIYRGCPGMASGHMSHKQYHPDDPDCIDCQEDELSNFEVDPECFINIWQDLFCIVTMDGHFRKVSKAWESILGFKEDEMEGKSYMELIHPDVNNYECVDGCNRDIQI